ncbi:mitochondrial transcription termination factor family protein [Tasmannia lanceolata]|uniref:mitochondrial transcription termination factor family protein n=1 Tax=Tasmannia lanceolata TaxID=3420 RepID=UPI004063D907
MEELLHLHTNTLQIHSLSKPYLPPPQPPPLSSLPNSKPLPNPRLNFSSKKPPKFSSPTPPQIDPHTQFRDKMLYLDSLGIDLFTLAQNHPPIVSSSIEDIKSTVDFIRSMGFYPSDLRRICGMCPEILTSGISTLLPVFTFLLREAKIDGSDLRKVINRRPRLLACDVEKCLRPTLYFLQMLGITDAGKHASLLSGSVEEKYIPRMDYLQKIGFSYRDSVSMVRRFPQLFCYSIKDNFEPKFDYFVVEMGRELKELKEFPQYFSFSLENRIKPRHQMCVEKGVCFPLPVMLKMNDEKFHSRLEVCLSSSPPLRTSPLWCTNLGDQLESV